MLLNSSACFIVIVIIMIIIVVVNVGVGVVLATFIFYLESLHLYFQSTLCVHMSTMTTLICHYASSSNREGDRAILVVLRLDTRIRISKHNSTSYYFLR